MIPIDGNDVLVVGGDGHTMEPDDLWTARMDRERWGDWVPRKVVEDQWYETNWVGGEIRGGGRELTDELCQTFGITPEEFWHMTESLKLPGGYDPDARVADMDRDGLDVAVLYPSMSLFFGPIGGLKALDDAEVVLACQQAYNDWVAEDCGAPPHRLFGLAAGPLPHP